MDEYIFKLILLGDVGVGKTSIMQRFFHLENTKENKRRANTSSTTKSVVPQHQQKEDTTEEQKKREGRGKERHEEEGGGKIEKGDDDDGSVDRKMNEKPTAKHIDPMMMPEEEVETDPASKTTKKYLTTVTSQDIQNEEASGSGLLQENEGEGNVFHDSHQKSPEDANDDDKLEDAIEQDEAEGDGPKEENSKKGSQGKGGVDTTNLFSMQQKKELARCLHNIRKVKPTFGIEFNAILLRYFYDLDAQSVSRNLSPIEIEVLREKLKKGENFPEHENDEGEGERDGKNQQQLYSPRDGEDGENGENGNQENKSQKTPPPPPPHSKGGEVRQGIIALRARLQLYDASGRLPRQLPSSGKLTSAIFAPGSQFETLFRHTPLVLLVFDWSSQRSLDALKLTWLPLIKSYEKYQIISLAKQKEKLLQQQTGGRRRSSVSAPQDEEEGGDGEKPLPRTSSQRRGSNFPNAEQFLTDEERASFRNIIIVLGNKFDLRLSSSSTTKTKEEEGGEDGPPGSKEGAAGGKRRVRSPLVPVTKEEEENPFEEKEGDDKVRKISVPNGGGSNSHEPVTDESFALFRKEHTDVHYIPIVSALKAPTTHGQHSIQAVLDRIVQCLLQRYVQQEVNSHQDHHQQQPPPPPSSSLTQTVNKDGTSSATQGAGQLQQLNTKTVNVIPQHPRVSQPSISGGNASAGGVTDPLYGGPSNAVPRGGPSDRIKAQQEKKKKKKGEDSDDDDSCFCC